MPTPTAFSGLPTWLKNHADILDNIAKTLAPVEKLITASAYIIGILFIIKAIFILKHHGESRNMMSG